MTEPWPKDRIDDLIALRVLIREVGTINNGSHCLQRIARCIELAEALDKTDYLTGRESFITFLEKQAAA